MKVTHNKLNEVIGKLTRLTKKGQPWAKKHKERMIRSYIREMERNQAKTIKLKEVLFYFWVWLKGTLTTVIW